jgi:hypothetical protein
VRGREFRAIHAAYRERTRAERDDQVTALNPTCAIADQNAMIGCPHSRRPDASPTTCSQCRIASGERVEIRRVRAPRFEIDRPINLQIRVTDDEDVN